MRIFSVPSASVRFGASNLPKLPKMTQAEKDEILALTRQHRGSGFSLNLPPKGRHQIWTVAPNAKEAKKTVDAFKRSSDVEVDPKNQALSTLNGAPIHVVTVRQFMRLLQG